ncbi:PREDICTED: uncharacterized protein LOC102010296 [Chinchilla lanigera]|uniref:uncharacterized protein LOC102010296 n=1 Tax=Chinchilla lanigera TaxID=34839 RepID=UPI00038F0F9A|nr:PREDICTED: uncharacterized protein LOC102010296 [Chinchilla lanigera]
MANLLEKKDGCVNLVATVNSFGGLLCTLQSILLFLPLAPLVNVKPFYLSCISCPILRSGREEPGKGAQEEQARQAVLTLPHVTTHSGRVLRRAGDRGHVWTWDRTTVLSLRIPGNARDRANLGSQSRRSGRPDRAGLLAEVRKRNSRTPGPAEWLQQSRSRCGLLYGGYQRPASQRLSRVRERGAFLLHLSRAPAQVYQVAHGGQQTEIPGEGARKVEIKLWAVSI